MSNFAPRLKSWHQPILIVLFGFSMLPLGYFSYLSNHQNDVNKDVDFDIRS